MISLLRNINMPANVRTVWVLNGPQRVLKFPDRVDYHNGQTWNIPV